MDEGAAAFSAITVWVWFSAPTAGVALLVEIAKKLVERTKREKR